MDDWNVPATEAIPRLLEQHGGGLFGMARRLCGNDEDARDLVQQVFLDAYRGWDGFEGRADPRTWLYRIAAHACQRMHRKRSGEPEHVESLAELAPFGAERLGVVPDDQPLQQQIRREAREHLEEAIAALPDPFRMPLVLKDVAELPVKQVAAILDLDETTCRTRIHRARLRLRQALERGLPRRTLPPTPYSRQVCLDLLAAKQEALDRGVPMDREVICDRCRAVFESLDLGAELCAEIGRDRVPADLRAQLLAAMGS